MLSLGSFFILATKVSRKIISGPQVVNNKKQVRRRSMQETLPCFNFQAIHRSSKKALQKLQLKKKEITIKKYKFPRNYHDPNTGFPGGSDGRESACNEGDLGLIPGL